MATEASPGVIRAGLSLAKALVTVRRPKHTEARPGPDDGPLREALHSLSVTGPGALADLARPLTDYVEGLGHTRPDELSRDHGLAYWINLYNAGALTLAARATAAGTDSVLRVPGAFNRSIVTVAGEGLSLDDIEHGKIRRYRDPRIHAALVCGSVSCPTLRATPFSGETLDADLESQMQSFMTSGGAVVDPSDGAVVLARVFKWFGADFVHPSRMPSLTPVSGRRVFEALRPWLPDGPAAVTDPTIRFAPYDWGMLCSVGPLT